MNSKFIALCLIIATCYLAKSQTVPTRQKMVRPKSFTIKLDTKKQIIYGYLSGINDSLVQLSNNRATFSNSIIDNPSYQTYNYSKIEKVNIRKYRSVGRGIGYGALIGAGVGGIVGLATYHRDPNSWFDLGSGGSAFAGAIIGAIPGIIIGAIKGAQMRKFIISRDKENFDKMRETILEMAIGKNGRVAKDSSFNK